MKRPKLVRNEGMEHHHLITEIVKSVYENKFFCYYENANRNCQNVLLPIFLTDFILGNYMSSIQQRAEIDKIIAEIES